MGVRSAVLCLLLVCGALGLTTPSARARLRCYACSFARPCYPVPTECQDDEACGISVGTSDQNEVIERKGCLPRAQCPLPGHATYWSRSYMLRHQCCEQDLCNLATSTRQLPSLLLTTLVLLVTGFTWGGRLLH
ncbi:PREDICTED: sperm acrosome membrane-associated protein 4-like isoform X2 [Chinchilla lanigera]|uniref:Sperm acrosome membrane-associated protein 4-like n=2 Tax=Chinchilla lanigera TaxID=34839 RepID=A0A8C2YNI2_CHILA|nr:PREDICTED: sperm acrosome membrane-associated protein 4-like isoform X2 [Chinchilla lanigera]